MGNPAGSPREPDDAKPGSKILGSPDPLGRNDRLSFPNLTVLLGPLDQHWGERRREGARDPTDLVTSRLVARELVVTRDRLLGLGRLPASVELGEPPGRQDLEGEAERLREVLAELLALAVALKWSDRHVILPRRTARATS